MKPKYFIIQRKENNPLWQVYMDWLNKTYDKDWDGDINKYYYGYDGNKYSNGTNCWSQVSSFKNNPTVLTLDQWQELFLDVLPEKWFLRLTEENLEISDEWRKSVCSNHYLRHQLTKTELLLSQHLIDYSYYYNANSETSKYQDYKEITTEQFIKHVYNPKFNIRKKHSEDYVIKALTKEHGAEIMQHFKDLGIDTGTRKGKCSQSGGGFCIYYGRINGRFSNYTLETVEKTNTLIKELPMKELKMYSVKELETNNNLVIYLDSQEEWNKLDEITSNTTSQFHGKHCYSLCSKTYSDTSSKTNPGYYNTATIITINQIKELNMEKEIIGYRLVKPEYKDAALKVCRMSKFSNNPNYEFSINSISSENLKEAGVLDLWFEPVYKTETLFTVGDWVYVEKAGNGAAGASDSFGQITEEKSSSGLLSSEEGINVKIGSTIWRIGKLENIKLRKATTEEINKAQEKLYTLGISENFDIVVKNKRAFYGHEDVTEGILALQKEHCYTIKTIREFGNYTFVFKEVIISKSGCITKESYLSQWLAIDLT